MTTCPCSKSNMYHVEGHGWLTAAMKHNTDKEDYCLVITGVGTKHIITSTAAVAAKVADLPIIGKAVEAILQLHTGMPIKAPTMVIEGLAASGALGAMIGAVQTTALQAKLKGASIGLLILAPGDWLDVTNDELHIEIIWPRN